MARGARWWLMGMCVLALPAERYQRDLPQYVHLLLPGQEGHAGDALMVTK